MDVQGLVRAVITAFEDASKLVQRIRDQRHNTDRALPDEPTRDLLESLALGPTIVKGQFDYEHRRWAEQYAVGDVQAREQMKDVLISLQMTLIITLRTIYMDDIEIDFDTLQTASDDCRVNSGVCLGQLSQRLSDRVKAQAMYPHNQKSDYANSPGLLSPVTPGLTYSSSRSTHSSSSYSPRTPQDYTPQLANMSVASMSAWTGTIRPPPIPARKRTTNATGPQGYAGRPMTPKSQGGTFGGLPPVGVHNIPDNDGASIRRPSSHTLAPEDSELLSPVPQTPATSSFGSNPSGAEDIDRASYISMGDQDAGNSSSEMSKVTGALQTLQIQPTGNSRHRFGPDDFTPIATTGEYSYGTIYDMYRSGSQSSGSASYSARAHEQSHSTLEHIRYLQHNSRPPRPNGAISMPQPMPQQKPLPQPMPSPQASQFPQPPKFHRRQDSLNSTHSSRKPIPAPNSSFQTPYPSTSPPLTSKDPHPSASTPIPVETPPMHQPVVPQRAPTGSITGPPRPPIPSTSPQYQYRTTPIPSQQPTNASHTSLPRPTQPQALTRTSTTTSSLSPTTTPLNLPTEKATQGFCKAAVRLFLQNGVPTSKAFSAANRPIGYSAMMPYWRCDKCQFEGPVITQVNTSDTNKKKKGKEEKIFDPKVRVSLGGGVRYRWSFLAKSHCALKSQVDYTTRAAREGEVGAFQCLFCCAEGVGRGWTAAGSESVNGTEASIRSGSSGGGGGGGIPVFGNLQLFLEHLDQTHRTEAGWPGAEMLDRMKCVVGRIAAGDEEWDINLVPLEQNTPPA